MRYQNPGINSSVIDVTIGMCIPNQICFQLRGTHKCKLDKFDLGQWKTNFC